MALFEWVNEALNCVPNFIERNRVLADSTLEGESNRLGTNQLGVTVLVNVLPILTSNRNHRNWGGGRYQLEFLLRRSQEGSP